MTRFPRITSDDLKNAATIFKTVLENKASLNADDCMYSTLFKQEILECATVLEDTVKFSSSNSTETESSITENYSPKEILKIAVQGYRKVIDDPEVSGTAKTNAVKFLRDAAKELDDLQELEKHADKIKSLTAFLKQFLSQLLDENNNLDKKTIATEFMNRLKELVEDAN